MRTQRTDLMIGGPAGAPEPTGPLVEGPEGTRTDRADTTRRWCSRRRPRVAAFAFAAVLLLPGGCAIGGSDDSGEHAESATSAGEEATEADGPDMTTEQGAPDVAVDAHGAAEPAPDHDGTVLTVAAGDGRHIVRTATLELHVEDGAGAADEVAAIAGRRGGFVSETDVHRDLDGVVSGNIRIRVPSEELFAAVEELDALAVAVPVRRIDERDVTAEVTDLRAALTNLEAYERELRALLADVRETTTQPDDLLTVFERVRSVRAEIDQAQARLDVLDEQVALSSVDVTLRPAASAVPVLDPTWAPSETVRDALTATARGLSVLADLLIRFALTVVPIVGLMAVPVVGAAVAWRRLRSHRTGAGAAGSTAV